MKLEIREAIDEGEKIVLKIEYDWEFAAAVAKICDMTFLSEEEMQDFVTMVLENIDVEDLGKLRYKVDE